MKRRQTTTYRSALAIVVVLASCRQERPVGGPPKPSAVPAAPTADQPSKPLVVSAAASTSEAMTQLCEAFHAKTGVEAKVNAGPTNGLASQILAGAPADVFLAASQEWADKVEQGGQAAARVDLLTNRLVVVVPRGNPAGVHRPDDLLSVAVKTLALAGENVPAGMYADQALTKLGLAERLAAAGKVVRGQDVCATLAYVDRGDAEAGIVYATDAAAAPNVEVACEFDPALHDRIVYVLILTKHGAESAAAHTLYEFLQGSDAEAVYKKLGFIPLPRTARQ